MAEPVVAVEHLVVDYEVGAGTFHALVDVSLEIPRGRVIGIVGETGCGKSTLAHTIPRLIPEPPALLKSGHVRFQGLDLLAVPKWKLPTLRGTGIAMVFQEPLNSLNPSFRVYDQMAEAIQIRRYREAGKAAAPRIPPGPFDYAARPTRPVESAWSNTIAPGGALRDQAEKALPMNASLRDEALHYLRLVRINDPETILRLFPHELSGGMRQRVMIAMALSQKPALLVADEPTSALDVTIQAQVLTLMKELIDEVHASILFISHDLGVIAEISDDLGVMYAGHLVEFGPVEEVFEHPRHPYTKALLGAAPTRYKSEGPLRSIPGSVPNLSRPPPGCVFHPRCPIAQPVCRVAPEPALLALPGSPHRSACHFPDQVEGLP